MLPPIIINESKYRYEPGDLTVFRSVEDAVGWMEPVDVENDEYFIFDAIGSEFKPVTDGESISIVKIGDGDVDRLIGMLRQYRTMIRGKSGIDEMDSLVETIEENKKKGLKS